ncbi:MAG: S9 family peptidase [Melioribacteraceae bacterium]|nr:S9 family peptidase [Melioribacteraceae bacterium]MCF8263732.1 S9 family peptidase [Melioribacteraceae bacterium]
MRFIKYALQLILFVTIVSSVQAQNKTWNSYDLFKIRSTVEAKISPDGEHIAFTLSVPRPFRESQGNDYRELYVYGLNTGRITEILTGDVFVSSLRWSPDSENILFLAKLNDDKVTQVYKSNLEGDHTEVITKSSTSILEYEINPNGGSIGYTATEFSPPSDYAELGFAQEVFEEKIPHRNLYIQNIETGNVEKITSDRSVFDFIWNDQGTKIAAAIAPENLVDHSYMFKRIFIIDASTKESMKLVENPGKLGNLAFSPDGSKLAFASASARNDAVISSYFVIPTNKKSEFAKLKKYSKGFKGSVFEVDWKDNQTVLFAANEGVNVTLSEQSINSDNRKIILEPGKVVFSAFDFHDGMFAFSGNTPKHPNELFGFDGQKLMRLTKHNDWISNYKFAKQEIISYKAKDGLDLEGILFYPLNYENGKKYPLITYIHGGPEAVNSNGWQTAYNRWGQVAAAQGFFVFMPNYRSGSGYGVDFTLEGLGDLAGKEYTDVLDGIDFLINKGLVNKNKVGVGGGSYGGYFSAWSATKHSERFAAAVVFVGISNQISKRNTTDIPYEDYYVHWGIWNYEDFEKVYDRSPVKYTKDAKTPTLILHGTADPRVHPSQSLELYRSLKMHGKAPVRLVWYPGEGHGNRKNPARLDYSLRTMQWFNYYLKGEGDPDQKPNIEIDYNLNIYDH